MIYWILGAAVWLVCGLLTTGMYVAQAEAEWPSIESYRENIAYGVILSILGPLGTAIMFLVTGFAMHGWHLRSKRAPPYQRLSLDQMEAEQRELTERVERAFEISRAQTRANHKA